MLCVCGSESFLKTRHTNSLEMMAQKSDWSSSAVAAAVYSECDWNLRRPVKHTRHLTVVKSIQATGQIELLWEQKMAKKSTLIRNGRVTKHNFSKFILKGSGNCSWLRSYQTKLSGLEQRNKHFDNLPTSKALVVNWKLNGGWLQLQVFTRSMHFPLAILRTSGQRARTLTLLL